MTSGLLLSIKVYALAVVISLLVALLIKGIVAVLSISRAVKAEATPVTARPPAPPAASDIPAIAAAVYAMMGRHRIVHIESTPASSFWSKEGRRIHQTSHAVPQSAKKQS